MLDPFVDEAHGDIAVDVERKRPPFHPHISAPRLKEVLEGLGHQTDKLEFFVTVRHPVELLASYYKFFKPDKHGRYKYSPLWQGKIGMPFEDWVLTGRLRTNWDRRRLAPGFISTGNLSPLSFEAIAQNRDGTLAVDRVFKIEDMRELVEWLEDRIGAKIPERHINMSKNMPIPHLNSSALEKIRKMFPYESDLYSI